MKTRLMDQPDDFKKIGVLQNDIQAWEDGRRDDGRPGAYEWWYFDSILDDGTKLVIIFYDKYPLNIDRGITPHVDILVTLPDGKSYSEHAEYTVEEASYPKGGCDVKIGPNSFTGNLKEYVIKVAPINGLGADIRLSNLGASWRPGAGYIAFGEKDENYFTWLCSVPRGKLNGTLTVGGNTTIVSGFGYHDHQWGNVHTAMIWNHWIWIRQSVGDYNILVFDLVANHELGYKRYPLAFIQDKDGKTIFENTESVQCEILEEYFQEKTQKVHPKRFKYTFQNGGKQVEYTVAMDAEIESQNNYTLVDDQTRGIFDQLKLRPSYTRYAGTGELVITENGKSQTGNGGLIYEMIYNGQTYKDFV